jgi:tetratricopeptide (TPR) repeat protein
VSMEELQDFARRLVRGPNSRAYYDRLLDAAAVTRRGLELLQELARDVEEDEPAICSIEDPLELAAFRPGNRLLNADEEEAATGLGDFAVEHLRLSLGAGSVEDLEQLLSVLTDSGLQAELLAALSAFLKPVPAQTLEALWVSATGAQHGGERRSAAERLAEAMVPHLTGKRGDLLKFAANRLREALALIRIGREMLQEVAENLPGSQPESVPLDRFTPGAAIEIAGTTVPTDPLELLHAEVSDIIANTPEAFAKVEGSLGAIIAALDPEGRAVGTVREYLTPEAVEELSSALGMPEDAPAPSVRSLASRSSRRSRVNIGQLARTLKRAPRRYASIEACWLALSSTAEPFARRFAAGVLLCRMTRGALRVGKIAEAMVPATDTFPARMASFLSQFASAHIGNALRVQGNLLLAERLFLPWEEDDLLGLRAEYLALKATLRRVQRRFPEALELLDAAGRVAERRDFPGADELLAQTRIAAACTFRAMSEFKAAAHELRRALDVVESSGLSSKLRWNAVKNLAECLTKSGHLSEAGILMVEVEKLETDISLSETDRLRTAWIVARVRRPDEWSEAREQLAFVRQHFIDLGLLYDAALASLELAEWHAEELAAATAILGDVASSRHLAAIRELAMESLQFFVGADVTPEALAAIALFQYVSMTAEPSPAAFRKVERLLRQASLG